MESFKVSDVATRSAIFFSHRSPQAGLIGVMIADHHAWGFCMRQIWNHPLSREILLILIVKIAIIFAIWWAFFRDPDSTPPPTPEQVSRALLETRHAADNHKE